MAKLCQFPPELTRLFGPIAQCSQVPAFEILCEKFVKFHHPEHPYLLVLEVLILLNGKV